MRLKVIVCEVLFREICLAAAKAYNIVDLVFLDRGLHSNPDILRATVQAAIDNTDESKYQAVVLGYGLCSNGVAGLKARGIPLVIPRAHDCITLLVGSKEMYRKIFEERPGSYYYTGGWIERGGGDVPLRPEDGAGLFVSYEELVKKYGPDNAEYLYEMQSSWMKNYSHAVHIDTSLGDIERYREYVRKLAEENAWSFDEITGRLELLHALLNGDWDEERFLVVQPGQTIISCPGKPEIVSVTD